MYAFVCYTYIHTCSLFQTQQVHRSIQKGDAASLMQSVAQQSQTCC